MKNSTINTKVKVFFIIPSLRPGGAEKVMSYIAQNISKKKFTATLIIVGFEKDASFEVSGVNKIFLNEARVSRSIFKIASAIQKQKPEIVVGAIGHVNAVIAILSLFFRKIKFIGREVNVLSVLKDHTDRKTPKIYSNIIYYSYRLLDRIICQSNDMKSDLMAHMNLPEKQLKIINNPIPPQFHTKKEQSFGKKAPYQFITVGRLAKQKGHLRILSVLQKVQLPYHYTIIGNGPEKENILRKIKETELDNKITYIPFTNEVAKYLSKSDLFIQGSYVEGFPNALLESIAVGTPAIAFKAPGGIDEIIQPGLNGYIVENEEDFLLHLDNIPNKVWDPITLSKSVTDKYGSKKIVQDYEELFNEVINHT